MSRDSRSTSRVMSSSPGAGFFISLPSRGRSAVVPVIFSGNISRQDICIVGHPLIRLGFSDADF